MAWGSMPSFTISGELTFERCAEIFEPHRNTGMYNISTSRPGRSNYHIEKLGSDAYALLMYRTRIITWFRDSSVRYRRYDSAITYQTMNKFGPLNIWTHSRAGYRDNVRFGRWGSGTSYPFAPSGYEMEIDAGGFIHGLYDERRRIIPERRPIRREKLKKFRAEALGRIVLGEFDCLADHGNYHLRRRGSVHGWWAMLPSDRVGLFTLLSQGASHGEVSEFLLAHRVEPMAPAESKTQAFAKAVQGLARAGIEDYRDYEWHRIEYDPVNWRTL